MEEKDVHQGTEQQLFSWDMWDHGDDGMFIFYNPILKVALIKEKGEWGSETFNLGDTFSHAVVNYSQAWVEFFQNPTDEKGYRYHLMLSIGERITT